MSDRIMPDWWYGPWATPAELRKRPDADRIDGYKVMSGRPLPINDRYWDDCVIKVPYRVRRWHDAKTPQQGEA